MPLEGKRPVNTPEWTWNGVIRYGFPLVGDWSGSFTADYRWVDDRYLEATNQIFDRADAFWVVNMRATAKSADDRWEFSVFARNLFDEEYLVYMNNIGFFKLDTWGETRSIGATVRRRF